MKDVIYRKMSPFEDFCIHHQRSIPVVVLSGILISTWFIFYGTVSQKGRRLLYSILVALSAITVYGACEVNNEYQELQGYIIHAVLPFLVAVALVLREMSQHTGRRSAELLAARGRRFDDFPSES